MRWLLALLLLSSCGGGDGGQDTRSESPTVIVDMHFGALQRTGWVNGDPGGLTPYPLAAQSAAGAQQLTMVNAVPVTGELITLKGADGEFYSAVVASVSGQMVTLKAPLPVAVAAGQNCWNAYNNETHVNEPGFYMIVDYALRTMPALPGFSNGRHVLLGDSWFVVSPGVVTRLTQRLPSAMIIGKGVGGNTAADLIARFAADVPPQQPNFVWILVGTNDYFQRVPAADYAARIDQLIAMTKAIGAVPIVFTSSVGSEALSPARFTLSEQYAQAIH